MDTWGQHPEIVMMRQVFRQMEAGQDGLLAKLKISLLDSRLPRWRQRARVLFEQYWHRYTRSGDQVDEAQAGVLYAHCLVRVMVEDEVQVPAGVFSEAEQVLQLFKEDDR